MHQINAPLYLEVSFIHNTPLFPVSQLTASKEGKECIS